MDPSLQKSPGNKWRRPQDYSPQSTIHSPCMQRGMQRGMRVETFSVPPLSVGNGYEMKTRTVKTSQTLNRTGMLVQIDPETKLRYLTDRVMMDLTGYFGKTYPRVAIIDGYEMIYPIDFAYWKRFCSVRNKTEPIPSATLSPVCPAYSHGEQLGGSINTSVSSSMFNHYLLQVRCPS